jgi:hypothetical protein
MKSEHKKPPTTFMEKCYKDKDGTVVFAQVPNLPIIVWFACQVLLVFITHKTSIAFKFLDLVAFGSLFTWAWLELFSGVNYFRRGIGLVVLSVIILSRLV